MDLWFFAIAVVIAFVSLVVWVEMFPDENSVVWALFGGFVAFAAGAMWFVTVPIIVLAAIILAFRKVRIWLRSRKGNN